MKQIFTLILGDLGLFLLGLATSIGSWFLFPLFVQVIQSTNTFKNIIGYVIVCPFAVSLYASSILAALTLILRGIKAKKWWWLCLGLLMLVFNIVIVIKSFV